ncbi:hypothetical protein A5630_15560 [Mycolicibacterium mucogenicum]|uniref:DNA-binding response regulator n=1 Tax=Mycolicibacterium mucogenicum TaxID=56689 RepID=A0A1A3HB75_MYCMU|nr:hypothetical protein A5630_15560 [Mycolicibacterium mucogenicum]
MLVVDEHELVQVGLETLLSAEPWVASCLRAGSSETAWQIVRRRHPQLVLVSTTLGGRSALEFCGQLRDHAPYVKVVLMSGEGRVSASVALSYGAVGSLPKHIPTEALVTALRSIAEGARLFPKASPTTTSVSPLSRRELDVLQHLVAGLSNPEMATLMNLSRHTVKQHTSVVYRKLGVRNRAQAASRAQELGLVV